MKITMLLLTGFFSMILAGCGSSNDNYKLVGGPCTYDDFAGGCTMIEKSENGKTLFTFNGTINSQEVELKGNKSTDSFPAGQQIPCSIKFIKTGACTPCLFSIGECGKEAWDAFRSYK